MGSEEIILWLEQRQYAELEHRLREHGTNISSELNARLTALYEQTVPSDIRESIAKSIELEWLLDAEAAEQKRRYSAFRITENGRISLFERAHAFEFLHAARMLRQYMRKEIPSQPAWFADCFSDRRPITQAGFEARVSERMENGGKVTGVFDIDFDEQEFSTVNISSGWATFEMKDVLAASYHAFRKENSPIKRQWEVFLNHLDGKEISMQGQAQEPQM